MTQLAMTKADPVTVGDGARARFGDAVGFAWVKAVTLRSTWLTLGLFALSSVAVAVATGAYLRSLHGKDAAQDMDAVAAGLSGLRFGLVALVAFGVVLVGSEFASGSILSSLTAVPRRGVAYLSTLLVGAGLALGVGAVVSVATFAATQLAAGPAAIGADHPGAVRAMAGGAVYLALLCVFAMGVTTLVRSATVALSLLLPFFFIVSTILENLPPLRDVARFLPDIAGGQVLFGNPPEGSLGPVAGLAVLALWSALAAAAGWWSLRRLEV